MTGQQQTQIAVVVRVHVEPQLRWVGICSLMIHVFISLMCYYQACYADSDLPIQQSSWYVADLIGGNSFLVLLPLLAHRGLREPVQTVTLPLLLGTSD